MIELELLGRSADGQSIVFTDQDGERYTVFIDDKLRASVRRSRSEEETAAPPTRPVLRPADIQSLLRQGRGAEDIAERYGVKVESIRRYESPIAAEKAWAVAQAQRCPVGLDPSSPSLEELVINRLATRGVDRSSLQWGAQKQPTENWEVSVSFIQSAVERVATWRLVGDGSKIEAIDQEAHWLTESAAPSQSVRALFGQPNPIGSAANTVGESVAEESDADGTERLLDQLNSKRGKRQPLLDQFDGQGDEDVLEDAVDSTSSLPYFSARIAATAMGYDSGEKEDDALPSEPAGVATDPIELPHLSGSSAAGAEEGSHESSEEHTADSDETDSARPLFTDATARQKKQSSRKRGKRRSVPSWDEIVFGARTE